MNLEALTQKKPYVLGLGQFVVGFAYITVIVSFLQGLQGIDFEPPEFLAAMMMLTLLVLSATFMGTVVLGIPLYLALKGNWAKALKILGFTLLYAFIAIAGLAVIALVISQ